MHSMNFINRVSKATAAFTNVYNETVDKPSTPTKGNLLNRAVNSPWTPPTRTTIRGSEVEKLRAGFYPLEKLIDLANVNTSSVITTPGVGGVTDGGCACPCCIRNKESFEAQKLVLELGNLKLESQKTELRKTLAMVECAKQDIALATVRGKALRAEKEFAAIRKQAMMNNYPDVHVLEFCVDPETSNGSLKYDCASSSNKAKIKQLKEEVRLLGRRLAGIFCITNAQGVKVFPHSLIDSMLDSIKGSFLYGINSFLYDWTLPLTNIVLASIFSSLYNSMLPRYARSEWDMRFGAVPFVSE